MKIVGGFCQVGSMTLAKGAGVSPAERNFTFAKPLLSRLSLSSSSSIPPLTLPLPLLSPFLPWVCVWGEGGESSTREREGREGGQGGLRRAGSQKGGGPPRLRKGLKGREGSRRGHQGWRGLRGGVRVCEAPSPFVTLPPFICPHLSCLLSPPSREGGEEGMDPFLILWCYCYPRNIEDLV